MITIDQKLCKACGICGKVCPRHIPVTTSGVKNKKTIISEERKDLCMDCGHCYAVCPNGAVSLDCFERQDMDKEPIQGISDDQVLSLFQQRRSVRRYKDKPVPREIINNIVSAADTSPTGTGRMSTGVIVIDDPMKLKRLSDLLYNAYEDLAKALKNPIARFMIRMKKGKQTLDMLRDFIMPGMKWYIKWYREGKSNEILRDCHVLILYHSPVNEPVGSSNCLIAAYQSILMAQVLNIGTCFNDLVPPMCNKDKEIRELIGLPGDREIYAGLTMGYPKYKFRREIPRKLTEKLYLD